jgi:hypothetical protein
VKQGGRRLADEIDAAQERGEMQSASGGGDRTTVPGRNGAPPTAANLGLSRKDTHEWRKIADAARTIPAPFTPASP